MFDYEKFNEYIKHKFPESMSDWWVEQLVENLTQWMAETYEERPHTAGGALYSIVPDIEEDEITPFIEEYEDNKGKVVISLDAKTSEITISLTKNGEQFSDRYASNPSEMFKEMIWWRHFYEDKGYKVEYNFARKE